MDENTAKEIAKENMWKTLQKMVTESDMKSLSTEDQIFTRKLKIFSTGVEKDLPEHYPDDSVEPEMITASLFIQSTVLFSKFLFLIDLKNYFFYFNSNYMAHFATPTPLRGFCRLERLFRRLITFCSFIKIL